jgi:hypothetical protein
VYVQKKEAENFADREPSRPVRDLLDESEQAVREGNSQHAYRLSVQATQAAPDNLEAWLLRATLAPSLNERIICVNHLNELAPGYQDRYNVAFFALKDLLDQDPFLAYLEETDDLYRVINSDRVVLSIPKKRAPVVSYPPEEPKPGPLRAAYRWLAMSIAGLLLAGLGTVVFAPLAALAAIRAQHSLHSHPERLRAAVVLILSFGLFVLGFLFSILFVLHWLG